MERNEGFLKLPSDGSSESASVSMPAHSGIRHLRHLGLGGGGTHALAESDADSDCCCCGETALRYAFQSLFRSGSNYLACGLMRRHRSRETCILILNPHKSVSGRAEIESWVS